MGLSLMDKIRLLAKLSATEKSVEEGIRMKNSTKILAAILGLLTTIAQIPVVQAWFMHFIEAHPAVALAVSGILSIATLLHVPVKQTTNLLLAFVIMSALLLAPARVAAQAEAPDAQNLYAAGLSYNASATPAIAGTGLYARRIADSGTYAFTAVDALPSTVKPYTVTTNMGAGIAQKVATIGKVRVYVPSAVGISWTGTNTGWQWNAGALAAIPLKSGYSLMPSVRMVKSSVSNGAGYQPIIGVLFGWGK